MTSGVAKRSFIALQGVSIAWHHRLLIFHLTRREVLSGIRGSLLGWVWLVAVPLVMLAVYLVCVPKTQIRQYR
jgi:ABC-type polysaccharide/polyol phosphate export permease